jgi:hypothetical protein
MDPHPWRLSDPALKRPLPVVIQRCMDVKEAFDAAAESQGG